MCECKKFSDMPWRNEGKDIILSISFIKRILMYINMYISMKDLKVAKL